MVRHTRVREVKPVLVQLVWLGLSLAAAWLVLSLPVAFLVGESSLGWLAMAAAACFLPGCLVLSLQPMWQSAGAAGFGAMSGAVLRIVFVAAIMLVVAVTRRDVAVLVFAFGLSVFYLVALLVETLLVVQDLDRRPAQRV